MWEIFNPFHVAPIIKLQEFYALSEKLEEFVLVEGM